MKESKFLYKGHRNYYTELNKVYFWTIIYQPQEANSFDRYYSFDMSTTVQFYSAPLYSPDSFYKAFSSSFTTATFDCSSMKWFVHYC